MAIRRTSGRPPRIIRTALRSQGQIPVSVNDTQIQHAGMRTRKLILIPFPCSPQWNCIFPPEVTPPRGAERGYKDGLGVGGLFGAY
eukprot:10471928-Heterocapsa_arctica.AAC.1